MAIHKLPDAKDLEFLRTRMSTQFQIPSAYDDALSYQGLIYKLIQYLKDTMQNVEDWNVWLEDFVNTFDTRFHDTVRDKLKEMYDSGELAELTAQVIDVIQDQIDNVVDELNVIEHVSNNEPHNIIKDVQTGDDITNYLNDLFIEKNTIVIPEGVFIISSPVVLPDKTTITGNSNNSTLHFIGEGQIDVGYYNTISNIRVTADEQYSSSIFTISSRFVTEWYKQNSNILIEKITAEKTYISSNISSLIECVGYPQPSPALNRGFTGLICSNIVSKGFNYPVHMRTFGGWLNSNKFIDFNVNSFTNAIRLVSLNDPDLNNNYGVARNLFSNWMVQYSQHNKEDDVIYENVPMDNKFENIDPWDLSRWDSDIGHFGNVLLSPNETQPSTFFRHGTKYYEGRYYPIISKLDPTGWLSAQILYLDRLGSFAIYDIANEIVRCYAREGYQDKFTFRWSESKQTYYIVPSENTYGGLFYVALKNAGTFPGGDYWYWGGGLDNVGETVVVTPIYSLLGLSSYQVRNVTSNGYTGTLYIAKNGFMCTIVGEINANDSTAISVTSIPKPMEDFIVRDNEGNRVYQVSSGSSVLSCFKESGLVNVSITYPMDIQF